MGSSGLWQDIKKNPQVLAFAILLHVVLIALLSINLFYSHTPHLVVSKNVTIKAVAVDASKVDAEVAKLKHQAERKKQKQLAEARAQKLAEQKAARELKQKQLQLAALEKKKQQMLQVQRERQKQLAIAKKKQAAEAKRQAELKRQQAAEAKRQAVLKRKQEAEKKKLAAEAAAAQQKQAEADLKNSIAAEEKSDEVARQRAAHERELDVLRAQYVKLIEQKVSGNWRHPAIMADDSSCDVLVTQTALGDVISVHLQNCKGDTVFQQSVERAVWKSSPLPPAPNPDVFDREVHFTFTPPK